MTTELMTQLGYVFAAGLFIFGLKMLGSPATARRGNMVSHNKRPAWSAVMTVSNAKIELPRGTPDRDCRGAASAED